MSPSCSYHFLMMKEITLKLEKSYAERMSMMELVHKVEMDKIRYESAV